MKWQAFLVAFYLLIATSASAVEFGPNSAKISNPYFPIKIGDWKFSQGVGPNWSHKIFYVHAIGTERVSGARIEEQVFNNVQCLKINAIINDNLSSLEDQIMTISIAQDTDGNVWFLKMYMHNTNETNLLGGSNFKSMFMPANPAVGLPAGIRMPENEDNYCRIVEMGINSLTTSFHTFSNCIKANCYGEDPDDTEVDYFCRGFGIVRDYDEAYSERVLDLKEYGSSSSTRTVVIPMSD